MLLESSGPAECPACDLIELLVKWMEEALQFFLDGGIYIWMYSALTARQALAEHEVEAQTEEPTCGIEVQIALADS